MSPHVPVGPRALMSPRLSASPHINAGASILDRLARRIVLRLLTHIRAGELTIIEGDERLRFGECVPGHPLRATIEVHSPRFYGALLHGSVGLGESYMDGVWDCADLVALTRLAALNVRPLDDFRRLLSPLTIPFQRWLRWLARNTPRRARRRVAAHYDLGNELFSLFLDPTMMYSCALFDSPQATLQEASLAKLERICVKLDLRPEDHVLEIGSGWGGFAVYAAEHHGCRVTTTTISRQQHAYASQRVHEAGLQDRVTVLLEDYRDRKLGERGCYDKLVSIEMIEAVGWQYLGTYFRRCSELLRADGAMLLQAIVIDRSRLPRGEGLQELHQHLHLPRRLPALAAGHLAHAGARERSALGAPGGHHPALRRDPPALA